MPNYIVNSYGVVENPEIITLFLDNKGNEITIRIAEIDNLYYTGFRLNCSNSFASSPCSIYQKLSSVFECKEAAILDVLDFIEAYLNERCEYRLLDIVKKYRNNNFVQLTLF